MVYRTESGNGPRAGRTTGRQRTTLVNLRSKQTSTAAPGSALTGLSQQYAAKLTTPASPSPLPSDYAARSQVAKTPAAGVVNGTEENARSAALALAAARRKQQVTMQKAEPTPPPFYDNGFSSGQNKWVGDGRNMQVWMREHQQELMPLYSVVRDAGQSDPNFWRRMGKQIAGKFFGWGPADFAAIDSIIMRESRWDPNVVPTKQGSTARGIPQTLMRVHFGDNWQTNPQAQLFLKDPVWQITWLYNYIKNRYGTPQAALAHKDTEGWY